MNARAAREAEIQKACEGQRFDEALTLALRCYGRELYGFLVAILRSEADASEVLCEVSEELWRSLPRFRWESSLRTWAYTLARRGVSRFRRAPHRAPERNLELSGEAAPSRLRQEVRTETALFQQSYVKSRFAALRESLPEEDQLILILRVDKNLSWKEIARVFLDQDEGEATAPAACEREAARLRKRFELLKRELVEWGKREGFVGGGERP